jgi:hypothetical protein
MEAELTVTSQRLAREIARLHPRFASFCLATAANGTERKMCNVLQIQHVEFEHYHLGKGTRFEPAVLRAPVASPRHMALPGH